jgi:hypothetical protein
LLLGPVVRLAVAAEKCAVVDARMRGREMFLSSRNDKPGHARELRAS